MYLFEGLLRELEKYLNKEQVEQITQAYILGRDAHEGQKRSSGEPYITHPVAVARILAEMRMDHQSIMAAILHDTIEDTYVEKAELAQRFGEPVAELVEGVSKLAKIHFESREQAQAENFRKMMMAMVQDIRVILIKLSDRLHNMQTLGPLRPDKRRRIAHETLEIYAPIALRLGINDIRIKLEELGFQAIYPMRARVLKAAVKKARGNRKDIIAKIQNGLSACLEREGMPSDVIGREKHLYSLYRKMHEKRLSLKEVMDVYGFRIIVDKVDTCYRVLGAVHNLYKPIPKRFKDYIALPKPNGYQSLHTTLMGPYGVPIEIQIRTREMDEIANHGVAAHWLYKSDSELGNSAQVRARQWMRGLLEIQKKAGNSQEFIENVKLDLFPDEIYLFSPDGEIFELPAGATAVDFAYAVHTDIGNACVGVKLDKRVASLNTPLSSGQTVEIITAKGAKPNSTWLSFVVTGKARAGIRHFLKNQHREESMNLGRRLLDKVLGHHNLDECQPEVLQQIAKELKKASFDDVLADIGFGSTGAFTVAQRILKKILHEDDKVNLPMQPRPLAIHGTEGMVVSYAKCCRPIPGDEVVGVFSAGKGMVIHTIQCKNVNWSSPENYTTVEWEAGVKGEFVVELKIEVINQRGVLARLATAISEADSNIININIDEKDGHINSLVFQVSVTDRVHLAKIIRRIRVFKWVIRVTRYKH